LVQFQYNSTVNRNLECSPFKATFGIEPPIGLKSTVIPSKKWIQLNTEQDLMKMMNNIKVNDQLIIDEPMEYEEEEEIIITSKYLFLISE
jgi:hypothetical protein